MKRFINDFIKGTDAIGSMISFSYYLDTELLKDATTPSISKNVKRLS